MANNTIISPKVDSCRDTKIFGAITPDVFQAILDSIPAICRAVLNWEPLAVWFLAEIIRQIPLSGELLYLGHLEFGRILFSEDSSDIATRRRIGRAIKSVKRCQLLSGFKAVDIQSGEMVESHGKKEYFPTTYQLKEFFIVFLEFRDFAKEQDLMSLNRNQRKNTQFAIAKSICDARGYVAIPKMIRDRKEKKEKSANGAEAESARPAETRVDNHDTSAWLDRIEEEQFECGQAMLRGGQAAPIIDSKLNARCTAARLRLKAARERTRRDIDLRPDELPAPDVGLCARGRLAIEMAVEGLKDAMRAAEEMGRHRHVDWLDTMRAALEKAELFRANKSGLRLVGGQPK